MLGSLHIPSGLDFLGKSRSLSQLRVNGQGPGYEEMMGLLVAAKQIESNRMIIISSAV